MIELHLAETAEHLREAADILREAAQWMIDSGNANWDPAAFTTGTVRQTPHAAVYLAFVDGQSAGTLQLIEHDPFYWPNLAHPRDALFVHKRVRRRFAGQGVAYKMLDGVCVLAREMDKAFVRLECRADRPRLRAFYGRYFDFVDVISLQPDYNTARFKIDLESSSSC